MKGFKQKRAKSAFHKLAAACGNDFDRAVAELKTRFGVSDPLELSDKQALQFIADMRMGAYGSADLTPPDELDADEFDPAALVPAETGPRKIDVDAIYARWNKKKAGVKIYDRGDDLDAPE